MLRALFCEHQCFGEQISEKYECPKRRRLLQADNKTPLRVSGGTSKWMSKLDLKALWMVVLHFLVLPSKACPHTLSQDR